MAPIRKICIKSPAKIERPYKTGTDRSFPMQVQLKSEKDQWTKELKKQQRVLEAEKQELGERMEKFKRDEEELERTITDNRRAKEDIQRQLARLREQQKKLAHDQGVPHSSSYPSALAANKNNSNSNSAGYYEDSTGDEYSQSRVAFAGYGLADMPAHLSKSHSSLEGELGEAPASRDSHVYAAGDYPRTFPGGKREPAAQGLQTQSVVAAPAGQAGTTKPLHLQFSAANQVVDHMVSCVEGAVYARPVGLIFGCRFYGVIRSSRVGQPRSVSLFWKSPVLILVSICTTEKHA